jgi:hypothetical protein
LPVSVEIDRKAERIYGSSGYFSPGVWYAGAGIGKPVTNRLGVSMSFSHARTSHATSTPGTVGRRRSDLSGGASFDVTPNISVFGSVGRNFGHGRSERGGNHDRLRDVSERRSGGRDEVTGRR